MTKLDSAVQDFVSSLSEAEQEEVRVLILNPQVRPSLDWYRRVMMNYLQGPLADLLIAEIAKKYPDEAVWRQLDAPQDVPFFEAGIILRESQALLSSAGA